jgi:hypothetical protein
MIRGRRGDGSRVSLASQPLDKEMHSLLEDIQQKPSPCHRSAFKRGDTGHRLCLLATDPLANLNKAIKQAWPCLMSA